MSDHVHQWKMTFHMDNCHSYTSGYSCGCGATLSTLDERDISEDSYSIIWMMDDEGPACPRCAELIDGAEAKHEKVLTPAGQDGDTA